jgi:putative ABC transport system permease protein
MDHMHRFWQDLRYAIRSLSRKPVFAAVAILSLAVGLGATTVVYSIVDAAVLNPFPSSMDRLVGIGSAFPHTERSEIGYIEVHSAPEFADVKRESTTLEHIVAFDLGNRHILAGDRPERVFTAFWWGNPFPTLGLDPTLGRGFNADEIRQSEPVAVISHRLWISLFAADRGVLGETISVTGDPYTIIGVMPPDGMLVGSDLWLPMWADPETMPRGRRQFQILGRRKTGVSLTEVNTELAALAGSIEQEHMAEHEEYQGWRLEAASWTSISVATYRSAGTILLAAVGLVVLLVCANIANLILARSATRQREMSVRRALGAGQGRILQQLMTENALLALVGGALGIAGALASLAIVTNQLPVGMIPTGVEVGANERVLLLAALATVATVLVFGLLPAIQASRPDLRTALHSDSAGSVSSRASHRLHRAFVTAQVALAVILLAGAGLLINSFARLQRVDPGYDAQRALTMRITLPRRDYSGSAISVFFETMQQRLTALPGVSAVAVASQLPPTVFSRRPLVVEGQAVSDEGGLPVPFVTIASSNYQETMSVPLLTGRLFDDRDRQGTPMVAVINEAAARQLFGDDDPLGRRIRSARADSDEPWIEVIGVVGTTKNRGLEVDGAPEVFLNVSQVGGWWNQLFLVIRTEGVPADMLPAVRRTVADVDPGLPVYFIRTLDGAIAASIAQRRVATGALTAFALTALLLAAIGIYGVVSYSVSQRTREIGLRMALGAAQSQVSRYVVRQALWPVGVGLALGVPGAIGLSRLLTDVMFEVTPGDPLTIAAMAGLLAVVGLVASYVPARRASRLDPVTALRSE